MVTTLIEFRKPLYVIALFWGGSFALMLASQAAKAELLCDCTQVVDTCSATVTLEGMQVKIDSDSQACSRVDYLVEGQPFAALVVGGSSTTNWPGQPLSNPAVVVENCRVCASGGSAENGSSGSASAQPAASAAASDSEVRPLAKVMPVYPRAAWANRLEGTVTVAFDVSAAGIVQNIRVVDASNQAFVNNTIDAISRFRFTPARDDNEAVASAGLKEQFKFELLDGSTPTVTSKTL